MPQLDMYSIFNQYFWGSVAFGIFYYLITFYFVPVLFSALYARKAFSANQAAEALALVSVIFAAHIFIDGEFGEVVDEMQGCISYMYYLRFVKIYTYDRSFQLSFRQIDCWEDDVSAANEVLN